ncbi:profilin-2-like [Ptychodera flava]|uniref:profilin-2-like n=1 Tax=Ptychodera flava TaxID=63121 RepID=UPI003969C50C
MSWQVYVDQSLLSTGKVSKAAIHGHDGNLWATSTGFSVTNAEVLKLVEAYKDPSGIQAGGLHLAGTKYTFLRTFENEIYGKKGSDQGCCIVKTPKAIIIGVYEAGMQGGEANKVVGALGDYLKQNGY